MVDNQELRSLGLKVTVPRIKILQIFEEAMQAQQHLSAEDVYRRLIAGGEDVGLATVYRVLTQFESANLVKRHNFEGGHCVFELNQGEHHDHMVCLNCGHIQEFVDDVIERQQAEVCQQAGFKMTDHVLTIYGLCQTCDQTDTDVTA